jgi:hypothetical protein
MKVSRIYDAETLNERINEPDILVNAAPGYVSYDLSEFVYDIRNIVLSHSRSMAIFQYLGEGVYQGHYMNPSDYRGRDARESSKMMLSEMFTNYPVDAIYGRISRNHRAARVMTRSLGFTMIGKCRDAEGQSCVEYLIGS